MSGAGTLPFGAVRSSDPDTSREAARICRAPEWRNRVLRRMWEVDQDCEATVPQTADRLAQHFGRERNIISSRLSELAKRGLVYRAGKATKTDGDHSWSVTAFALTDAGREAARQLGAQP